MFPAGTPFGSRRHTGRSQSVSLRWLAGVALLVLGALLAHSPAGAQSPPPAMLFDKNRQAIPPAPAAGTGPLSPAVQRALAHASGELREQRFPASLANVLGASGDPRLVWYLYDLLRFADGSQLADLVAAFEKLAGARLPPAPPGGHGRLAAGLGSASATGLPRDEARSVPADRATLGTAFCRLGLGDRLAPCGLGRRVHR
jgi:hypothetical protein